MLFGILYLVFVLFFFFKQKTAYEMRISDWSSDVCSSDLTVGLRYEGNNVVDAAPIKIISKHENAGGPTWLIKRLDRLGNAGSWIARADTVPYAQLRQDDTAPLRRVRNPLSGISREHAVTLVIHDLDTQHLGIGNQDFLHFADDKI